MAARRARRLVVFTAAAALFLASCSSDGQEDVATEGAEATTSASVTEPSDPTTTAADSSPTDEDWIEEVSAACQAMVDELAVLDTEAPGFLDERVRIRDEFIAFVESTTPPAAMEDSVQAFVDVMAAESAYDRDLAAAARGEAVSGAEPPAQGGLPDLGLDCGDES